MMQWLRYPGNDLDFLGKAREWVFGNLDNGVICPGCMKTAKRYVRKLNAGMAYWLIRLVLTFERTQDWVYIHDFAHEKNYPRRSVSEIGGDFAKLRNLWGLIVQKAKDDDSTKRCSGIWRPTQLGMDFAHGRIRVPQHITEYKEEIYSVSEELTTIQEALPDKFNYPKLMEGLGE